MAWYLLNAAWAFDLSNCWQNVAHHHQRYKKKYMFAQNHSLSLIIVCTLCLPTHEWTNWLTLLESKLAVYRDLHVQTKHMSGSISKSGIPHSQVRFEHEPASKIQYNLPAYLMLVYCHACILNLAILQSNIFVPSKSGKIYCLSNQIRLSIQLKFKGGILEVGFHLYSFR